MCHKIQLYQTKVVLLVSEISLRNIGEENEFYLVMWDRGLRVRNLSFFNFPNANTQAIFGPIIAGRCLVFCGGKN